MQTTEELRNGLARSMIRARQQSGLSINKLAALMGVSDKTISSWEAGRSRPDAVQYAQYLDKCNVPDVMRELMEVFYPNIYKGITTRSSVSDQKAALAHWLANAPDKIVKQLFFLILGAHGSNFIPQLQELVIHDSLPLESRILLAENMHLLFELNQCRNAVDVPDPDILPDMDVFQDGIKKAKQAVKEGKRNYIAILK